VKWVGGRQKKKQNKQLQQNEILLPLVGFERLVIFFYPITTIIFFYVLKEFDAVCTSIL
jgi:hypothetical protein